MTVLDAGFHVVRESGLLNMALVGRASSGSSCAFCGKEGRFNYGYGAFEPRQGRRMWRKFEWDPRVFCCPGCRDAWHRADTPSALQPD